MIKIFLGKIGKSSADIDGFYKKYIKEYGHIYPQQNDDLGIILYAIYRYCISKDDKDGFIES